MSWFTYVIVGVVAVCLYALYRWYETDLMTGVAPTAAAPANWGADPDDQKWDAEAAQLPHTALSDVRGAAEKWGSTVAALLGLFGVVAFAQGPSSLTDVPGDDAYAVLAMVLIAVVLAGAATYTSAIAAQGSPATVQNLNGYTLKAIHNTRLPRAVKLLKASRALTLAAILLVLGAVAVASLGTLDARDTDSSASPSVVVVKRDGTVVCGTLKLAGTTLVLVDTMGAPSSIAGSTQVVPVDKCPT
jgi:hypothetical protein